jgi:hypothetical protein
MLEHTPKTKNVYVPLALIGLAVVLMLVEVLFLGNHASHGALEVLSTVVGKTIMYGLVLLLGIGLCSWFGYPFDPIHWSLLQLLAVALIASALRGTLGLLTSDAVATLISLVLFLGLIGYFFNDEPMNALIAIFLIAAAHSVVTFLLMPLLSMLLV